MPINQSAINPLTQINQLTIQQINQLMQNKANLLDFQMNVSYVKIKT